MKIQGVWIRREAHAKEVGSVYNVSDALPSTGTSTILNTCVRSADSFESLLDVWNKLFVDCITIRSQIGGIDSIRIIIVRCFMAERNKNELRSWSCFRGVGGWYYARVPGRCRLFAIAVIVSSITRRPMALVVDNRVPCLSVVCVVFRGQDNVCSNVHIATPELA